MWRALAVYAAVAAGMSRAVAQSDPVPITGVLTGIDVNTGARPARQNINDLYSRGDPQWDLYVQALTVLQEADESTELSYFQIAGIHGIPYIPWNGVDQVSGGPEVGYCPHGDLLFATWHRPYLALFEQTLVSAAQNVARQYPTKLQPTYQAAAQSLRLAYWDWGTKAELPPAVISENVTVNGPGGRESVRNPFYNYHFQKLPTGDGFGGSLAQYLQTLRCPTASLENDASQSNNEMNSNSIDATYDIYDTFTRSQTFEAMAFIGSHGPSFENPHNGVHNWVSCPNGTMEDLNWSAFDPLFFLHHVNVDRLVALWQAIHYNNSMFNIVGVSTGQFGTAPGTSITADSPLKPFFDKEMNFHTSNSVRDIRDLGYTYPELVNNGPMQSEDPEELASATRAQVNALYGHGAPVRRQAPRRGRDGGSLPNRVKYYTAEIQVDRAELQLPCSVNLVVQGRLIASMSLLNMPIRGIAFASVPLQASLSSLQLQDAAVGSVVPFLQDNIRVLVKKRDGTMISIHDIPSLRVDVQDLDYVPRIGEADFPHYGRATKWPVAVQDAC